MSQEVRDWIDLNADAEVFLEKTCRLVGERSGQDSVLNLCHSFLAKAHQTLSAINVLYANNHEEAAQALIRVLLELRINFDCFLKMAGNDPQDAAERLGASILLDKAKQMRASAWIGYSDEIKAQMDQSERDIKAKFGKNDFDRLRKFGFTGKSMERRAQWSGHGEVYSIIYRNFSRNVHGADHMEMHVRNDTYAIDEDGSYRAGRDVVAHYTAHWAAVGMAELTNHMLGLGLEPDIVSLGTRQVEIKKNAMTHADSH